MQIHSISKRTFFVTRIGTWSNDIQLTFEIKASRAKVWATKLYFLDTCWTSQLDCWRRFLSSWTKDPPTLQFKTFPWINWITSLASPSRMKSSKLESKQNCIACKKIKLLAVKANPLNDFYMWIVPKTWPLWFFINAPIHILFSVGLKQHPN